jgi:cytochrome oxidase Cu insertion factor (SCO1/SenC/PrrC family)
MRGRTVLTGLLLVVLLGVAGCGFGSSGPVAAPGQGVGTQLDGAIPAAITDLRLVDSTGHARHLSDFAGKVVVISDSMSLCQESCPLDTATVVRTARAVAAAGLSSKVEFLTVTVDPVRDTVPQLAAYRKLYDGPANWLALTGSPADVQALWKYFGVYTKKVADDVRPPTNWRTGKPLTYDIEHSDEVFFLDAHGHERFILEGMPAVAGRSAIPGKLYKFLSKQGRGNVNHPAAADWTEPQAVSVLSWLHNKRVAA